MVRIECMEKATRLVLLRLRNKMRAFPTEFRKFTESENVTRLTNRENRINANGVINLLLHSIKILFDIISELQNR